MPKRKVSKSSQTPQSADDLFAPREVVDRNPTDERAMKSERDQSAVESTRESRKSREPGGGAAGFVVPVPLYDFEFPPELQLPSMEALLEPPGVESVAPSAIPTPTKTKVEPRPQDVPRTAVSERTREDPDSSIAPSENLGLQRTSDTGVPGVGTIVDDVPGAMGCGTPLPVVDAAPAIPPRAGEYSSPWHTTETPLLHERKLDSATLIDDIVEKPATRRVSKSITIQNTPTTQPAKAHAGEDARAPTVAAPSPVAAWAGVLFVGDLHLAHRVPGFRRDDYPKAIIQKLHWVIDYAKSERLLPVLLGDLFDFPRDNANWLLVELHQLLAPQTPAIYGNHDCKENTPGEHDTVSILVASGLLRLLSAEQPWTGMMNGCRVVIGGTSWGQKLPWTFERKSLAPPGPAGEPSYVLWASHHDLRFPGFEEAGRMDCREVAGVDLVVNGHIHRELHDVSTGRTRWMNPGSICRIARSDASRAHVPGVLRVDVSTEGLAYRRVMVPHLPFDEVFHPDVQSEPVEVRQSLFIRDLEKLQSIRTTGGLGLREFLDSNLSQFEPAVSAEIRQLAEEVLSETA